MLCRRRRRSCDWRLRVGANQVDQSVRLNRALWLLADGLRQLKA